MKSTKKGEEFLPNVSKFDLKKLYKKEKDSKAKLRLLATILRKEGKSLSEISSSIQKPIMTISDWLKNIETSGLNRIYNIKQTGKPSKLSEEQLKKLENILEESPEKQGIPFKMWTTQLVQYIIKKVFDVLYKMRNIRKIVKKLNFGLKVPRPENIKKNKKAVEEFKKKLRLKYNITLNLDSRSSVLTKPILR
ncbi:MAG: winged helix-turn-helix domain-containing protein [Nanoarchaeota archaeon]